MIEGQRAGKIDIAQYGPFSYVHRVAAVVAGVVLAQFGQPFLGAQRLKLGEGEVLGEPAGDLGAVDRLRRLAVGELRWLATSVVPLISFSRRATSTPSLVATRSGSM